MTTHTTGETMHGGFDMIRQGRPRDSVVTLAQPTEPRWYAVMTNPRMEEVAARNLKRLGYWTFYPFKRVRKLRKRANVNAHIVEWVNRPYFSRYIFVALRHQGEGLYAANEADGVSTVVYLGDKPLCIPNPIMDELMDRANDDGVVGAPVDEVARKPFQEGQLVGFKDNSPLCGLLGQIAVDDGKSVMVWLQLLGASRKVSVEPSAVAEIAH